MCSTAVATIWLPWTTICVQYGLRRDIKGTITRVERVWKCSRAQQGGRYVSSGVLGSERERWTEAGNPSSVDGGVGFMDFTTLGSLERALEAVTCERNGY